VQERQLEKFQLLLIAGTKVVEKKAHIYSGTSNAIDSYEIPKSFKKGHILCTNLCQFSNKCYMVIRQCENDLKTEKPNRYLNGKCQCVPYKILI